MRRLIVMLAAALVVPGLAAAATIESLSMQDGSLTIALDQAAEYQIYELEAPARVVLAFPGTKLAPGVGPVAGAGEITSVHPRMGANAARIEIGLAEGAKYRIEEQGANLIVRTGGVQASGAPKVASSHAVITGIAARDVGDVTELVIRGSNLDANHNVFLTNQGRTLILDFWGGESRLSQDHFFWATQRVSEADVGAAEGRVRIVAKLLPIEGMAQHVEATPSEMVVRLGRMGSDATAKARATGIRVEDVSFRPDDRIAHVVVRTNRPGAPMNLTTRGKRVIMDLAHATLAPGQERTLDVSAFPGPVRQVDVYRKGDAARIVARLREDVEVTSYQAGNVLTVNFEPKELALKRRGEAGGEKSPYTGERVTFDFKDIDIRNALKLIAEMSDLNIIMSDDVSGTLTMRLVDVPWDQALDLILSARGLGKERVGNVMRIAPMEVLQADAEAKRKAMLSVEDVAPLETEFIHLGYASVTDVKKILEGKSVREAGAGVAGKEAKAAATMASEGGLKLLSKRGSILMDERSN
ncbi:MAG: AMIN domain-containing protein, partial [Mariprofundaceae bacterium]